ncbi:hypothetical protein [Siphonobacter sp.]|uniref:hypothetical protein n=1 Tax=Siphonobacter sp. TaxID=1869184 RepID=UPI003B3AD159
MKKLFGLPARRGFGCHGDGLARGRQSGDYIASEKDLHLTPVRRVSLLGGTDSMSSKQTSQGLVVQLPDHQPTLTL